MGYSRLGKVCGIGISFAVGITVLEGCVVDANEVSEDAGETQQTLLGNLSIVSGTRTCTSTDMTEITDGVTLGRKIARSSAYLQCLIRGSTSAMVLTDPADTNGHFGPYQPCSPVQDGDPNPQLHDLAASGAARVGVRESA
jgi:hypothetical protein